MLSRRGASRSPRCNEVGSTGYLSGTRVQPSYEAHHPTDGVKFVQKIKQTNPLTCTRAGHLLANLRINKMSSETDRELGATMRSGAFPVPQRANAFYNWANPSISGKKKHAKNSPSGSGKFKS